MIEESKLSRFILELIKKTKKDEITWSVDDDEIALSNPHERIVDYVYRTEINEKNFRLFKYTYRHYKDEDEWDISERIRLDIVDNFFNTIYEFPYEYSLYDLYDAVREQNSGITDFIDEFLK